MAIELLKFRKGIPTTSMEALADQAFFTPHKNRSLKLSEGTHHITPAALWDGPFRHFVSIFPDDTAVYTIVPNEPDFGVWVLYGQPTVKYYGRWQFQRLPEDVGTVVIASDFNENGVARVYAALRYRAERSESRPFFRE